MHGYFSFEVHSNSTPNHTLVIFCATHNPLLDDIVSEIRKKTSKMLVPDSILLLGFEPEFSLLDEISKNTKLRDNVSSFTRHSGPPPISSHIIPRTGIIDEQLIEGFTWRQIRESGMLKIFKKRDALLVCPPTYHFAKPSGMHSDRFIWAANTLVDGAEIMFIAAQCLPFITSQILHYYCDTGAIATLAFAIDSLIRRFDNDVQPGTVNTFGSYEGLKTFEFQDCDSSIVLVSASTTGNLENQIKGKEPRFNPKSIITLFNASPDNNSQIIMDLTAPNICEETIGNFTSHPESDCPHCKRKSIPVPMFGDHFIPVRANTRSIQVKQTDAPKWLYRFLELTGKMCVLKAHFKSKYSMNATANVFLDMENIIDNWDEENGIVIRLKRLIAQNVPVATRRIVHLDDPASNKFANRILQHLSTFIADTSQIEVVPASQCQSLEILEEGATVVAAAVIASGYSLLGVSQVLRQIQNSKALTFLVGLSRMSSKSDCNKLENNIRMGEVARDFAYHRAESISLPLDPIGIGSSWSDELILLEDLSYSVPETNKPELEERIDLIRNSQDSSVRGLANKLFWHKEDTSELSIRRGFVFFPESMAESPNLCSQGDVYFAIVSVLHYMRNREEDSDALRQTEYERRVISPLVFDRFNDGVIQASFLRAAVNPELDYATSKDESNLMAVILHSILDAADSEKSEAKREFILALALRRLTLTQSDMNLLIDKYSEVETDWLCIMLWTKIKEHVRVSDT